MSAPETTTGSFPNPFTIETPEGAEGWERMYPYYALFSDDRREREEEQFFFQDSMHYPEPMYPFDMVMPEQTATLLNANTTRYMVVPTASGIEHRVVNGYVYVSPSTIDDPDEVARRAALFAERAGHYFENWETLYEQWVAKAKDCRERMLAIEFAPLPDAEPLERVQAGQPLGAAHGLIESYHRLLETFSEIGHLHFEMLGLGYGAYNTFADFCANLFPGMSAQTVARMVAGIDILMFRPDDELKRLSRRALELGVEAPILAGGPAETVLGAVGALPQGQEWLDDLERTREPWFWFSTGAGQVHSDPAWNDDLAYPLGLMAGYIGQLQAGQVIDRPLETIEIERDRITAEYRDLIEADEDRATFDEMLALARMVYPFVENHNFYCEHQHHSQMWNKVRELGDVFAARGFLEDREDIFMLQRFEIELAIWDLLNGWATEAPDRGAHWRREIAERKRIMDALRRWTPPPALGPAPEAITEPFTVMLWGVTDETVRQWQRAASGETTDELQGVAASPGVAEGLARVITSPADLDQVQPGEVLVCAITAPSWAPVFGRIAAAVSDIGGIMAHAAIVSREYGLPAVVGTGFATSSIRTGQRVRVDGSAGRVTILEDAPVPA